MKSSEAIGRITGLYRYPAKSARGERLDQSATLTARGIVGDRRVAFALLAARQGITRKLTLRECPALNGITATYKGNTVELRTNHGVLSLSLDTIHEPNVQIETFSKYGVEPIAGVYAGDQAKRWISNIAGVPAQVVIVPNNPTRLIPSTEQRPGEATTSAGSGTDGYPLHLIHEASIAAVNATIEAPRKHIGVDRFRPNITFELFDASAFAEEGLDAIQIGDNGPTIYAIKPTMRCPTIQANPETLSRDDYVMNAVKEARLRAGLEGKGVMGVWAAPEQGIGEYAIQEHELLFAAAANT